MKNTFLSIVSTIVLSIFYFVIVCFLDFYIISPLILPTDHCYYHTHEIPFWVELLYMSAGSNGHPEGSLLHFGLLLVGSIFLGKFTAKVTNKKIINQKNT